MSFHQVLLTDVDNTLYNWVDFFAPSFRAMVHVLSRESSITEEDLLRQFKDVYLKYGSLEYRYSIQKLAICRHMPEDRVQDLVDLGRKVFGAVRSKRLKPYDGVLDALRIAVTRNVPVVAVTNSPVDLAANRIKQLGLSKLIFGVAGWEGLESAPLLDSLSENPKFRVWRFRIDELKPQPIMYERILKDLSTSPGDAWVIGDSLHKDLEPGVALGMKTVFARYGTIFDKKNFETLLKITHWDAKRVEQTYDSKPLIPDRVVDRFDEIVGVLDGCQPLLPWHVPDRL
jgi:FMN phosphatase YigB (HAD superfamily)